MTDAERRLLLIVAEEVCAGTPLNQHALAMAIEAVESEQASLQGEPLRIPSSIVPTETAARDRYDER